MSKKPVSSIERITPSLAKRWLDENNKGNRLMNHNRIDKLAEDFKNGKHPITNDAIAFDTNGTLWNGQHRLQAIVLSNVAVDCLVIRGTDPEAFMFADAGMKRSGGQALSKLGYQNNIALSALAGSVRRWLSSSFFLGTYAIAPNEIAETVRDNPFLVDIVAAGERLRGRKKIPWRPLSINMAIYIAHLSDYYDEFIQFLEQAAEGAGLSPNSPVLALRNRFMNPTPPGKTGMIHEVALFLKAFQWHIEGRRRTVLSWREGEAFPVLEKKKRR